MIKAALKLTRADSFGRQSKPSCVRARNASAFARTIGTPERTAGSASGRRQGIFAAIKPLFAVLTDEQKPVAERLLVDMRGGGRGFAGHGHRSRMGGRTL